MKVVYLITKSERGGAQVHVLDILRTLRGRIEPVVIAGDEGFLTQESRKLGAEVHILADLVHPIRPVQDVRAIRNLTKLLKTLRPDILHGHTAKAGLVGRIAARLAGVPALYTVHSWSFVSDSKTTAMIATGLERMMRLAGSTIIEVCRFNFKSALARGVVHPTRHVTIWNGIPDSPFQAARLQQSRRTQDPIRILMTARFAWPKDHGLLLQALARVDTPWHLTLAGDGPNRDKVEQLTAELNLRDRVTFLGDTNNVDALLAASDIFVLSSRSEGLPLSILEAMRAGLPVIGSDVGGVSELVTHGISGYVVPAQDIDSMRRSLETLIHSPDERLRMGQAGRTRFERDFQLESMTGAILAIYREQSGIHSGCQQLVLQQTRRSI